jgi:hypothetical protein
MGILRAARTVSSPSGEYWEIYVSKLILPPWREGQGGEWDSSGNAPFDVLSLLFSFFGALWAILIAPLLRFLALLPVAMVRRSHTHAVRIEAITGYPDREVYRWTTTDVLADRVLDEIVTGLARGEFVQPEGTVYAGRVRD